MVDSSHKLRTPCLRMANFVERMRALRIGDRYTLVQLLGRGTFGRVYLGKNVETGEEVAIKLEHRNVAPSLLDEEIAIYDLLQTRAGFPRIFWQGWQDTFRVMVFELLGPNLEDLLQYCGGQFSLKTTLMLLDQLLQRFESLHRVSYIHRDVKPENFMLGTGVHGNTVYMTDLGLATHYHRRAEGHDVLKATARTEPSMIGTCRYASVNAHLGVVQSPRDDLEALGYMMVYFLNGSLPWQGIKKSKRQDKYRRVLEVKQSTTVDALCHELPPTFTTYFQYVQALTAVDVPDYRYLRRIFRQLFRQQGFTYDHVFDWTMIEFYRQESDDMIA